MKNISIENVKKHYGKSDNIVKAVDGVSLDVGDYGFTAIVGTRLLERVVRVNQLYYIVWQVWINLHLGRYVLTIWIFIH